MSKPRRRVPWAAVFGVISAAALAICIGSATYGLTVSVGQQFAIGLVGGALMLQDRQPAGPVTAVQAFNPTTVGRAPPPYRHDVVHFYRHDFGMTWWPRSYTPAMGFASQWIEVPLWMPVAGGGLLWGAWLVRRHWRVPPGHCRFCRYDLRSTDGAVCPECGRAIGVSPGERRTPAGSPG